MPNYNRRDMPQVKTQNLGKALDAVADKVRVSKEMVSTSKLKKSQKELFKDKVKGIASKLTTPKAMKPLIISKDNHIVDGHHRWAAAIYKWGDDTKIPVNRIHLNAHSAIKLYKMVASTIDEVMSIAARKKLARKSKSKLRRGMKKRIKKMKKKRSNDDLQKAAMRQAKTILMKKMLKKAPDDMTMTDRVKFSKKLKPGKIEKVAKKILPKLKRAETERVKKMKARNTQKNEAITIPIEIGDTVLGGKFKNKRIVVKSIDKNEKGDITINGKPLLKYRLLDESTINEIPMGDLQKIDTFADKKLNPVDVVITDKHFFDRLNDPRNGKEITSAELIGFFKRLSKHKKDFVEFLNKYNSVVAMDDRTNINIPFMKRANKAIAKTVMRKKDFKTPDQKLEI